MNAYQELESIFTTLNRLNHLNAITSWDEAVMMPTGGGEARANALATLKNLAHQLLTDKKVQPLIDKAKDLPLSPWQKANLTLIEKEHKNATCLPAQLVEDITKQCMRVEQAWRRYRAENNWKDFAPLLQKNIELIQASANIRAEKFNKTPYDILLDDFSPGINQAVIDPVFDRLKTELPPLVQSIMQRQQQTPTISLNGIYAIDKQKQLGLELMQAIGFDFNHGRLDVSHHPFCGGVPEDVRITTRYNEKEFITAAMGICHETGHACYEQGLPKTWLEQPVGKANSMTLHESQSLLIEMQACRSQAFMQFISPLLKRHFGDQDAFNPDNLFRLYTRVQPNLIRVDADEVTYPLHVILRYEIEKAIFNQHLNVKALPELWNEKISTYLGLNTEGNYQDGVMQDVHWAAGLFGYFPAYTLGSLCAAQFYAAALQSQPAIPAQIERGDFTTLRAWLKKNIHERGSSVSFSKLLHDATGSELSCDPFLFHIKNRYLVN